MKLLPRLLVVFAGFTAEIFAQGSYLDIMGIIRGDSLGSEFGKKVVPAGDVNGDTLPDFLVLATGDQKVYLFHGKKGGLDTLPDLVFEHKAQLESLGDINGDGSLDFAMRETGQNYRISLYFGGSALDTIRDGYVKGDSSGFPFGDYYGRDVSAGKLSDVGNAQISVFDPNYNSVGRVYAYNGQGGCFDSLPFWILDSLTMDGFFVWSSKVLGDINGDGFADLAIGLPTFSDTKKGEVRVFMGGSSFDVIPDVIIHPPSYLSGLGAGDFGESLAGVGDLNNDNRDEFIISSGGLLMLYFGSSPLDTLPRFRLDRPGLIFTNGGDIDHDGFNDLLVGFPQPPITGAAYLYFGGPTMDSIVDLEIDERDLPTPAFGFGQAVAGLGDIDGNGSNDFAVGSTSNTDPDRGYLWVFNGLLPSTGVGDEKLHLPRSFELKQNYPNPFNSGTTISYSLSRRTFVRLEIFNILGALVKVAAEGDRPAGSYRVNWDAMDALGKALPSGIYIYRLKAGTETETKKMMLIR